MKDKIREIINNSMKRELGMTYDEFEMLNFDEQQRLIEQNRQRKRKKCKSNKVRLMVGSGEHSILVTKKRGERYILSDGTLVIAGDTPEESRERLEKKLDDLTSSKPMTFVKKLSKKQKNRNL